MDHGPEHLYTRFRAAFNRHDLDEVVSLYEVDAVLIGSGSPAVGQAGIRAVYQQRVCAAQPTTELETLGVNRLADLAMLDDKWRIRNAGSEAQTIEGRSTEVARVQPDGHPDRDVRQSDGGARTSAPLDGPDDVERA